MSKNYVIKPANNQDIPRIVQLVNVAYRGGDAAGWTSEGAYLDGERTNASSIAALMAAPGVVFLKAEESGVVVGCVCLEVEEDGHLHLGTFAVDPSIQAQGLGRMMLNNADEYARARGFAFIYITVVSVRTELIDWYIRRGFEATGRRIPFPVKWGEPRMAVDFIEMRRPVS